MKSLMKKLTLSLTGLVMVTAVPVMAMADTNDDTVSSDITASQKAAPDINAKAGITIDAHTGQILYSKNIHTPYPIASMTKLLTIYIVLQQIQKGKLHWNQNVAITPALARFSSARDYVNIPFKVGGQYTVYELYRSAIIGSANDAALALAKQVAGTPQKFVLLMRKQAKALGIHDDQLYNACGLTNGELGSLGESNVDANAENKLSAADMAIIAKNVLQKFPYILKNTSVSKLYIDQTNLNSGDLMLPHNKAYEADMPMDGLKTGTSDATGGAFTGTMNKDGRRIITVVLHAPNAYMYDPARFTETKKMVRYVYSNYTYLKYGFHSQLPIKMVKVANGKASHVNIHLMDDRQYWIPKNHSVEGNLLLSHALKNRDGINAPVKANQLIGKIKLTLNREPLKFVDQTSMATLPMATSNAVAKLDFWARLWHDITSWF